MLDHLKQEREAGNVARERTRLALVVAALLVIGGGILAATRLSGPSAPAKGTQADPEQADPEQDDSEQARRAKAAVAQASEDAESKDDAEAVQFDPALLQAAVAQDASPPYRWSLPGFEYLETIRRSGAFPRAFRSTGAGALAASMGKASTSEGATPIGEMVQVEGRVIERTQEAYTPPGIKLEHAVLWSLLVEDPQGDLCVIVSRGDAQSAHAGAPTALAPGHVTRPIEVGDFVLVRGITLQLRVGTIGESVVGDPVPAIYRTLVRRDVPPDERATTINDPSEADWEEVHDLTLAETQRWDENVLYQIMQWARERGPEALRKDIDNGTIPWTEWDRETFEEDWRKEVDPQGDQARTFTEGARGKLFRLDGILAESVRVGWDVVPPNSSRVHDFRLLTLLADDYWQVSVRFFSPFDLTEFKDVKGKRKDHMRVYGMFVKNHTYRTRYKNPETDEYRFLTVPQFVLLAAEPHPGASDTAMTAMYWIAGVMAILALIFYFVLARGGRRQDLAMHEQRQRMRKRRAGLVSHSTAGSDPATKTDPAGDAG